ncbi:MAG: sigma-70 family RNA polymerase sigma factor [Gemmatimonadota bacterium]
MNESAPDITRLVLEWREGDEAVLEQLMPLVYRDLHALAQRYLQNEKSGHTLQATALVSELYLRVAGSDVAWEGRGHFFAVAARTMRRILVDHARKRSREKRGGGQVGVTLHEDLAADARPDTFLDLDAALQRLSELDERKAKAIELLYFGGLGYEEIAKVLDVSPATVHRDLRMARAWLYREIHGAEG